MLQNSICNNSCECDGESVGGKGVLTESSLSMTGSDDEDDMMTQPLSNK